MHIYIRLHIYLCQNSNSNFIKMKRLKLVFHNVTNELPKMLTDNMTDGIWTLRQHNSQNNNQLKIYILCGIMFLRWIRWMGCHRSIRTVITTRRSLMPQTLSIHVTHTHPCIKPLLQTKHTKSGFWAKENRKYLPDRLWVFLPGQTTIIIQGVH